MDLKCIKVIEYTMLNTWVLTLFSALLKQENF